MVFAARMSPNTSVRVVIYHSKYAFHAAILANVSSCSIVCSTVHKATHPAVESQPPPKSVSDTKVNGNGNAPRLGTAAAAGYKGPFVKLGESQELQILFKQYPNLQTQLNEIYASTLRPLNEYEDGLDTSSIHNRGHNQRNQKPWNHDQGTQRGVQALTKARHVFGKDGEGVREYSRLVLQFVAGDTFIDIAAQIQKELADENARIVSQLLDEDRW